MTNPVHLDPETMTKVAHWRAKSEAGTMTLDEYKAAILDLRASRMSALAANKASGKSKKASAPARSTDDMLSELEGL